MSRSYRNLAICILVSAGFITAGAPSAMGDPEPTRLRRWTNLDWAHKDFALFYLYGPYEHKPNTSAVLKEIQNNKSALDVSDFREVVLANDDKGITLWLNAQDSRALKTLAQKNPRGWFVAVAPPKDFSAGAPSLALVPITPTMANGYVTFKHPECAAVAQNLRRRFRIAEFRLTSW